MTWDRAGYLNNCNDGASCGSSRNRVHDSKLLKKELHYVETYAKTHDESCDNSFRDRYNNSCGSGYGCGGFDGCGPYNGGCGPYNGGCGPYNGGCGPYNGGFGGCGPCDGGFGGCGPCDGGFGGCGPCDNGFVGCGPFYKKDKCKKDKKEKKEKKDKSPCNSFCKPCYKPVCNDPCEKVCGCGLCKKSYKKIYKH